MTSATANDYQDTWHCQHCLSADIQVLWPAWYLANNNEYVEQDSEAEPLSVWCPECAEHIVALDREGSTLSGRWDHI